MDPDVTDPDVTGPDVTDPDVPSLPAILLCGGRGTRLSEPERIEKPLVEVGGVPMVVRVIRALTDAEHIGAIHAVTSPATPDTAAYLRDSPQVASIDTLHVVEGMGEGYVADLNAALDQVGRPALSVVADLPLLTAADVDSALAQAAGSGAGTDSLAVCVPAAMKRGVGISVDTSFNHEGREVAPTGLNVVGEGPDSVWTLEGDPARRLSVNVNRPGDLEVAERLAADE